MLRTNIMSYYQTHYVFDFVSLNSLDGQPHKSPNRSADPVRARSIFCCGFLFALTHVVAVVVVFVRGPYFEVVWPRPWPRPNHPLGKASAR